MIKTSMGEDDEVNKDLSINEIYHLIATIDNREDLAPLAEGFMSLLGNQVESHNTYLPDSVMELSFSEELLILFWRFIHQNPKL